MKNSIAGKASVGYFKRFAATIAIIFAISFAASSQTTSWTGNVSTDWSTAGNWQSGAVPGISTDVVIPAGVSNYPVLNNATASVNNLTLQGGLTISLNGSTLQIAGVTTTTGDGNIIATNGKVEFNGTSAQTIPAGLFSSNAIKDLVITNAAGVTLGGALKVTNTVSFGNVNNSVLNSNGFLTLASTSSSTASLADITNAGTNTGNNVTGIVTVERYVQGKRAYRFITSPVKSAGSIRANWMENTNNPGTWVNNNPVADYGTHISGPGGDANGFDATSTNNPSLFTFNNATQTWAAVPSTSGGLTPGNGFRIIVRGSRNVDLNNNMATPSATTLRAAGTLVTDDLILAKPGGGGTAGMPELSGVAGNFNFIANPYACSINWLSIMSTMSNISSTVYIFDPAMTGSNGRGGYVAYNGTQQRTIPSSSLITKDIQSGQAFFVLSTGSTPSLTFKESYKSLGSVSVFRTADEIPYVRIELLLPKQVNGTGAADEASVYFSDIYDNSIGNDDSYKFTNQDENLAIVRDGTTLCLEGRKPVGAADSIQLKVWQLTQPNYTFRITLSNFGTKVQAYLQDKFLATKVPLSDGANLIPFSIASTDGSNISDRFRIVFETLTTLPLKLTDVKAFEKNKGVQVEWTAESESNLDRYEVEKSLDGKGFVTAGSVKVKTNPDATSSYNWFDSLANKGDNYYRIRSIDKAGTALYSRVVKVRLDNEIAGVTVFPNPVHDKMITLQFTNVKKENYALNLFNYAGQKVFSSSVFHDGGSANHTIDLQKFLLPGMYQLQISGGENKKIVSVLVQ